MGGGNSGSSSRAPKIASRPPLRGGVLGRRRQTPIHGVQSRRTKWFCFVLKSEIANSYPALARNQLRIRRINWPIRFAAPFKPMFASGFRGLSLQIGASCTYTWKAALLDLRQSRGKPTWLAGWQPPLLQESRKAIESRSRNRSRFLPFPLPDRFLEVRGRLWTSWTLTCACAKMEAT